MNYQPRLLASSWPFCSRGFLFGFRIHGFPLSFHPPNLSPSARVLSKIAAPMQEQELNLGRVKLTPSEITGSDNAGCDLISLPSVGMLQLSPQSIQRDNHEYFFASWLLSGSKKQQQPVIRIEFNLRLPSCVESSIGEL
ncbi:unnamed protein product [Protopolystoma xenopodis]|uniref:Uncharacterized protein n=1 Tax=Protopolystoma xenopodis TaxID=117903 RepID=A0A3S5CBX3_9PLAT|nr:unnamed protein product [Protopolystoma xenopodis]